MWLKRLEELYRSVHNHVKEYRTEDLINAGFGNKILTKKGIGRYSARTLHIKFGGYIVFLDPVGTLLLGGVVQGRVDLLPQWQR